MSRSFSFYVRADDSLVLKVGQFCVQAVARQAHREVVAALLKGCAEEAELGALAETLERFLHTTNFAALRSRHPELAGGSLRLVRLYRAEDGGVRWEILEPQ